MLIDIHTHRLGKEDNVLQVLSLYKDFETTTPGQLYSMGIHPCHLQGYEHLLTELERYATQPNVLAIGECGLDTICNKDTGLETDIFRKQITLAEKTGKPLIIHCVRAYEELLHTIKEMHPAVPVIIHGYNKKADVAGRLLAGNMYLSFGAAIMNEASPAAAVLKDISPERFFLETDNSDASIKDIYQHAAQIRETSVETLILQLEQNFRNVFKYAI